MAKLAPVALLQYFDNSGNPLSGGKLYTYESGTVTPKTTYTDESEGTANANPIILDSDGRVTGAVWLGDGAYTFVLKDSADVTIDTVDDITGDTANSFGSAVVETASNIAITSVHENNLIVGSASLTASLLPAATAKEGFIVCLKNSGTGGDTLIIDPDSAETIAGVSSLSLAVGQWAICVCDGTNWKVLDNTLNLPTASVDQFIAGTDYTKGTTTQLTLSSDPGSENNVQIYFDSVYQNKTSYSIAAEVITFGSAISADVVECVYGSTFGSGIPTDGSVTTAKLASGVINGMTDTAVAAGDEFMFSDVSDSDNLKKDTIQGILDLVSVVASTQNYLTGLTLSNDTDTDHDINITAGVAADSANGEFMTLASEQTKQIDASWATGDDAGGLSSSLTVAADTTYHVFLVKIGGTVEVLFDTSLTCANGVTDHTVTAYRRIGSVITDSSSNIINFIQTGDKFVFTNPIRDVNSSGTAAWVLRTMTTPLGLKVLGDFTLSADQSLGGATAHAVDPDLGITANANHTTSPACYIHEVGAFDMDGRGTAQVEVVTNTSSQIKTYYNSTTAEYIFTNGYTDTRGK